MKLEGAMTALATPFKDGKLDEAAYESFIDDQVKNGISVLVPMGTTGEAVTCSPAEQARAVRIAVQNKGSAKVLGGAGSNDTAKVIEAVKAVRDAGADGSLIVTPYYNKPTQDGLVAHYRAVAKAHPGFPIVAYNVPGRTGVDMLPETCARLCDIPEVVALKEATANMIRTVDLVERCGDRLQLLSGDDFTIAPFIASFNFAIGPSVMNVSGRRISFVNFPIRYSAAFTGIGFDSRNSARCRGLSFTCSARARAWSPARA